MEKEPLTQSARFKMFVSGLVLQGLIVIAPQLGLVVSDEVLQTIAAGIAALFSVMIFSRGQRNTAR